LAFSLDILFISKPPFNNQTGILGNLNFRESG
jgi:hypothetical protein